MDKPLLPGILIAGLVVGVVWLPWVVQALLNKRAANLIFHQGDWAKAKRLLNRFGILMPAARPSLWLAVAEFSGKSDAAVKKADRLVARRPNVHVINQAVTSYINAGRYRRALEVAAPWKDLPWNMRLTVQGQQLWALLQINVAEAEYNLGHWDEALRRLERMRDGCVPQGIVKAGDWQQRAWILAHLGRTEAARAAIACVELADLPAVFHAEYHFTRARIAWAEGGTAEALACVERGLDIARRASSFRNGVFLRARIHAAAGATAAALVDFESAAAMRYRAQGGDALLAWGDLLRALGREGEARRAFELTLERDPESEASQRAAERLGGDRAATAV